MFILFCSNIYINSTVILNRIEMNPNLLTIYQSPFPKRRIGRWTDGGYAIADIPGIKYDALFAGGICDDISFEEDFIKYQQEVLNPIKVYAFDGTVDNIPETSLKDHFHFVKKNIGYSETPDCTNLHSFISPYLQSNYETPYSRISVDTTIQLRDSFTVVSPWILQSNYETPLRSSLRGYYNPLNK